MWGTIVKYAVKGAIALGLEKKAKDWFVGWLHKRVTKQADKFTKISNKMRVTAAKAAALADEMGYTFLVDNNGGLHVISKDELQSIKEQLEVTRAENANVNPDVEETSE